MTTGIRAGSRVAVFAKAPIPGEVKTRLIPALGEDGAAAAGIEGPRNTRLPGGTASDLSGCAPGHGWVIRNHNVPDATNIIATVVLELNKVFIAKPFVRAAG